MKRRLDVLKSTYCRTRKLPFHIVGGEILCHYVRKTRADHHLSYIVLVYREFASHPKKITRVDVQVCGNYLVAINEFLLRFNRNGLAPAIAVVKKMVV
jgi:hypothetical protein